MLATGVEHFAHVPPILSDHELVRHSSTITDPAAFAGKRVAIIGRGQSALESAALLSENGAAVEVITRSAAVAWNGPPLLPDRPLWKRLREPEAGLGSGWGTWFYSNHPALFRRLPEQTRIHRARTALGPAGAAWLRPRIEGRVPIRTSEQVHRVRDSADGLTIGLVSRRGRRSEVRADYVIAATGYRPDLRRLAFLDDGLRARIGIVASTAAVDAAYQTLCPRAVHDRPRRCARLRAGDALCLRHRARGSHRRGTSHGYRRLGGSCSRPPAGGNGWPVTITRVARDPASAATADRDCQAGQAGPAADASLRAGLAWRRARARGVWMLACGDLIAVTLAVVLAACGAASAACYGVLVLIAVTAAGLYQPRIGRRPGDQAGRLAMAAALPALGLLPWAGEDTVIRLAATTACLLFGMRVAVDASQRSARRRGMLMQQTLIIGSGGAGRMVGRLLREHPASATVRAVRCPPPSRGRSGRHRDARQARREPGADVRACRNRSRAC